MGRASPAGASERIWSLVSGLPSHKRRRRILFMLQAYIDDSARGDEDLFVLAGFVSTTEKWAAFSDEWQRLLDHRSRYYRKLEYFKMSEMTSAADRERCEWFYRIIEDHVLGALSVTIPTKELRRQVNRRFDDPKWRERLGNPWHHAVGSLVNAYATRRRMWNLDLPREPVDFVFDETGDKRGLIDGWDRLKELNPENAHLMGATPVFRDDKEYLPLQAADMLAWWVRHWQKDGIKLHVQQCEFPWPRKKSLEWFHVIMRRDDIRARLRQLYGQLYGIHRFVFGPAPRP